MKKPGLDFYPSPVGGSPIGGGAGLPWVWVAGVALSLVVGFAFGRGTVPQPQVRVEERVRVQEVVREVFVVRESTREHRDTSKDTDTHVRRVVVEKTTPDGTTERRVEEESGTKTQERVVEVRYVDRVVEKFVDREVQVEVEKQVEVKPALSEWNVAATVGLAPLTLLTAPVQESVVAGIEVRKRLVGPLSVGAWGQTNATLGLVVSLDL